MSSPWWHEPFRAVQTNIRQIDAGLDVESVLDFIEAHGADTWLLSVGGITANYPSELECQTVNPVLSERASGDLIGDAVSAAGERGIRVLGRMDFSKVDAERAELNPEWCYVDASGSPQVYNGYSSVCPNGPYYQRAMFDVVAEVLTRYHLGGLFFNMMHFNERDYSRRYWGVCHCQACLAGFAAHAPDLAHPTGPDSPGYDHWRAWSDAILEDLNVRMREHISALNPGAGLILKDGAHLTYYEANNAVGRPLWHLATAESVSAIRSADPRRAVFVNSVAFVDMPYRWAGEDPHHFAQYIVQAIAHGGSPSTYVMGTPDVGNYQNLGIAGELTRFHRDHSDVYRGLRSAARVGLIRGSGATGAEQRTQEFRGWYQGLVERHVPFDVVRQDYLPQIAAGRYDLLIAPDLGALSDEQSGALTAALGGGTTVVLTGESGWTAEGLPLPDGASRVRLRAEYPTQESLFSLHIPVDDSGDHVPVLGGFGALEVSGETATDWHALGRAPYGPPERCYGNRPTPHPGWVDLAVGPGRLVLLPWRPGLVYRETGLQRVRDAGIDKLLGLAGAHLRLSTDLAPQVHLVLGVNDSGSTVVHVLNRSGDAHQRFLPPVTIPGGEVRLVLDAEPSRVVAHVAASEPAWTYRDGLLELHTPDLGLFEVIEIRP